MIFLKISMSTKNKRMLILAYAFYLGVLKNNRYHCHVLLMKVISEIK